MVPEQIYYQIQESLGLVSREMPARSRQYQVEPLAKEISTKIQRSPRCQFVSDPVQFGNAYPPSRSEARIGNAFPAVARRPDAAQKAQSE